MFIKIIGFQIRGQAQAKTTARIISEDFLERVLGDGTIPPFIPVFLFSKGFLVPPQIVVHFSFNTFEWAFIEERTEFLTTKGILDALEEAVRLAVPSTLKNIGEPIAISLSYPGQEDYVTHSE